MLNKLIQQFELPPLTKAQREKKLQEETEERVKKGLRFIQDSLFTQANMEFREALQRDPAFVELMIAPIYEEYKQRESLEQALAAGLILLKIRNKDHQLANQLGNLARRLERFKEANNLYRHALKCNRDFNLAFYNLAASLGKVDRYDLQIQRLVAPYYDQQDYILPNCLPYPGFLEETIEELTYAKKAEMVHAVEKLMNHLEKYQAENDQVMIEETNLLIQKRQEKSCIPEYDDIRIYLQEKIDSSEDIPIAGKPTVNRQHLQYNLGLHALSNKDVPLALTNLQILKQEKATFEHIEMLIALCLDLSGKKEEATADMFRLLDQDKENRYLNINLGLLYKKAENRLLAFKYLAIGGKLLEQSEGMFDIVEMVKLAHHKYEVGSWKNALNLYKLVCEEINDPVVWQNMGEIYWKQRNYNETVSAFKQMQKTDPKSKIAADRLQEIHDIFYDKANELMEELKYSQAIVEYEKALKILRLPEVLQKASSAYKIVQKHAESLNLMIEYRRMREEEKEKEREKERQELISQGKEHLKNRQFNPAIRCFEQALKMKADRDVFMYLAYIYKTLRRPKMLEDLVHRWQQHTRHQSKYETPKKPVKPVLSSRGRRGPQRTPKKRG